MNRAIAVILSTLGVVAATAPAAHAAAPSCQRGGAKLLAADGATRVVSIKEKARNSETRRDRILGCRTTTGRRFTLFLARDFGLDLIERDRFQIVDERYIGVIRHFEGGASESRSAATWDARRRTQVHTSSACDEVDFGDFSGVTDAAFFHGGGLAYACGRLHIADARGDREIEPPGTDVHHLAVASNTFGFGERLYWTVAATPKFLDL